MDAPVGFRYALACKSSVRHYTSLASVCVHGESRTSPRNKAADSQSVPEGRWNSGGSKGTGAQGPNGGQRGPTSVDMLQ